VIQSVRSTRFPYLPVHVRFGNLQYPSFEFDVDALVDTGFDGGLTVPHGFIPSTVPPLGQSLCHLADGSTIAAFSYVGFVSVGSLQAVQAGVITLPHQTLLGRAVTNRFKLSLLYGRQVVLEA
jgi:predicted aspartyl protease